MKIIDIDYNSPLYDKALNIWNQVWTDYSESREEWQHYDKNYDQKYYFQRFIVDHDGDFVATGSIGEPWWSYKPGKFHFELSVLKTHRHQGVGSFCLTHFENILKNKNGYKFNTYSKEDYQDGVNFLGNRGYKIVLREPGSKLIVKDFDYSKFIETEKKVHSYNVRIVSLSELQQIDPKWQKKLYELYVQIMKDVPNNDEITERTFENFKNSKLRAPGFCSDAFFVALDSRKYVGLSSLWIQVSKPKEYWTDITGVLRSHRRRGIALALKVQTINYVKRIGGMSIETGNEENNPMFHINKLLGFIPLPSWLTYEKHYG